MLVLPCTVLGLSALVLALTTEHQILGDLFSDIYNPESTQVHSHTATTTTTSSSVSVSSQSTRYSTEQPTLTSHTDSPEPTAVKTIPTSGSTVLPTSASVESSAIDHSSKTWQIIGIAIIAVLFVATSITCAMFFDRLWTFLKDIVCCATRPLDSEQFIPDCEKQGCDTRSLSTLSSDHILCRAEPLREEPALHTVRARELPWSTDWNSLHRQPSQRNEHAPAA